MFRKSSLEAIQNNSQGNIPREIGGLVSLEKLNLSYNNFNGEIPKEIEDLKSIAILDLSWNQFEGNRPSSLGQLQVLRKMDLSSNMLTRKVPPDLEIPSRAKTKPKNGKSFPEGPLEDLAGIKPSFYQSNISSSSSRLDTQVMLNPVSSNSVQPYRSVKNTI
ncbi:hypothetical protein VIGAN_04165100 [Vigna angularis var. angularis]|uniref:Leucine-rich repeat-containing N-terminal plant-type domain-containing protein n=1 Tax=Vigna angularis var. angularis TaxID=157739 RepID=A0A0S3RV61_PHAAN|nr:hypothetical protein VIGAN_04165100 [Vigna angularis var. angularis]